MSISVRTNQDQGSLIPLYVDRDVTGATLTLEFSGGSKFTTITLTKPATATGRQVTITLTPAEVNTLKDSHFRVKADYGTYVKYVASGAIEYAPAAAKAVDTVSIAQDPALRTAFAPQPLQTAVLLGDSITNRSGPTTFTVSTYYQSDGYWAWAAVSLRHSIALLANMGVVGETSTQIRSRVGNVTALSPGWCILLAGTNDVISASDAVATATVVTGNLDAMYTALTAAGTRVVALTLPPCDNATAAGKQAIVIINQWIKRQARSRKNLIVADTHLALVDPVSGNYAASHTTDGTHPNTLSAKKMGRIVASVMQPFVAPGDTLTSSPLDPRQIMLNPLLTGTNGTAGAGVTGQVAQYWTVSAPGGGTAVASKVARTDDVPGDWQQIVISDAGTSGFQLIQTVTTQTLWAPADGFSYFAECEFELDPGYTNPPNAGRHAISCQLTAQNSGFATVASAIDINAQQDSGVKGGPYTFDTPTSNVLTRGVFRTPSVQIPATATRLQALFNFNLIGTARIARLGIRRFLTASQV